MYSKDVFNGYGYFTHVTFKFLVRSGGNEMYNEAKELAKISAIDLGVQLCCLFYP